MASCWRLKRWESAGRLVAVDIRRVSDQVVVTSHDGVTWVHCANVVPEIAGGGGLRSFRGCLRADETANGGTGYSVREYVVRTWLYLGDIVGPEGDTQRYIELNRARTDFFQGMRFLTPFTPPGLNGSVYPASTGNWHGRAEYHYGVHRHLGGQGRHHHTAPGEPQADLFFRLWM